MIELIKNIFRVFFGICIGIAALVLFVYFGGAKYVTEVGKSTERLGSELEKYEDPIKDKASRAEKTVNKTIDVTKETAEKVKNTVDKVSETVKKTVDKSKD